ncbi:ricin-type beta-trefoil lectin domain protein [Streptomyces sp. NBC_01198]|uniref:ricin-type beta-trefoil lectin domain protein n=1 Tax=Streptomyces sp. NBC_01198 TaxID=2903769 RepID=UPI002E166C64|nr:ricin-type beta-trefoil lectin domain protein [Streptomyces sp. NBC_01198]
MDLVAVRRRAVVVQALAAVGRHDRPGAAGGAAGAAADAGGDQSWTCNNSAAQQVTVGADGSLQILGRCVDVSFSGTANKTLVQLWGCDGTGSNAQRWNLPS